MIIPYMKWKIKAMFETTSYNDIMENDGEFFGNGESTKWRVYRGK